MFSILRFLGQEGTVRNDSNGGIIMTPDWGNWEKVALLFAIILAVELLRRWRIKRNRRREYRFWKAEVRYLLWNCMNGNPPPLSTFEEFDSYLQKTGSTASDFDIDPASYDKLKRAAFIAENRTYP